MDENRGQVERFGSYFTLSIAKTFGLSPSFWAPLDRPLGLTCPQLETQPYRVLERVAQSCSALWNYSAAFIFCNIFKILLPI
jgi:hypothetical protein